MGGVVVVGSGIGGALNGAGGEGGVMASDVQQDYCDWCMGPLSGEARSRSRWLGLALEDSWACTGCLEVGRYRVPPDGWAGAPDEWLAADEYVLGEDDLLAIGNALNEVLHGPEAIADWEFQTRIGVSRAAALRTLRRISRGGLH